MKHLFISAIVAASAVVAAYAQPTASAPSSAANAGAEVPQVLGSSNQDKEWQPTPAQRERVLRDVRSYFAAKDELRFADAYALFTATQKSAVPQARWEADMRAVYAEAGTPQGRTLSMVTWYKNPPNARPGVYAAVDFSSQFAELALHCGFVALQLQMDGSFGVAREEENSISKREMAKLSSEALQRVRTQYRC